jgi:DNA-binding transcriptional regulator WhiA
MGQKSSIEKLPKNLREKLLEMLNDPACTQAWIAEAINDEAAEAVLSKSGVNRYALRMKKFAEKNRQARSQTLRVCFWSFA